MRGGIKIGAGMLLPVLAAGAALAAPTPGKLETYRDWTIGCDNVGRCEAVGLMPEGGAPDQVLLVRIEREAGAAADVTVWLQTDLGRLAGNASLLVDGRKVADARLTGGNGKLTGPQASALAVAMARGSRMEVRLGPTAVAVPSLAGSAAALRYMDAQQGRAGTTTALIATGSLGPQAVKAPPPMPVVRSLLPPTGLARPADLWTDERNRAVRIAGCTDEIQGEQTVELFPLSRSQTLVLVPCGAGAYNFSSVPLIATGAAGRRTFARAKFDHAPGFSESGADIILVNADWDAKTGQLNSYAKGRGLGDCGNSEDFVWDGTGFRLVQATAMGECRGIADWITVWQARVDRRQ